MFKPKMGYLPAICAGLMALSGVAAADEVSSSLQPSTVVSYGDLDLSTQAGLATLHKRLSIAAKKVCPTESRDVNEFARARACQADAFNRAAQTVGGPALALVQTKGHSHS